MRLAEIQKWRGGKAGEEEIRSNHSSQDTEKEGRSQEGDALFGAVPGSSS